MSTGSPSQAGFYYQNNLAALKLLELFDFKTSLLHVKLENYDAGNHIDDIILTRKDGIEFYQVKWSQDEDTAYTIYNLFTTNQDEEKIETEEKEKKASKSLWKKLSDGYRTMQTEGKPATIVLYSTRAAGISKLPSKNIDQSLQALIKFHANWLSSGQSDIVDAANYAEFRNVLDQLQAESGFGKLEFNSFLYALRFKLSSPLREEIREQIENKANRVGLEATQVTKLLDLTVQWSITGETIDKHKLITELGINDRFVDRISHIFKIEEVSYIENTSLFNQLDLCLGSINSGFIFVEGVPGAGKSTALTKYSQLHPQIKFSYYCFIPGEIDTNNRLQGSYFLKSLCIAIEKNFPELDLPQKYSDNYADKLPLYLDKLSTLNERIIFLIDGLDHVDRREEFIHDPLTNHILSAMPDNLVMIMSAQYIEALPLDARTQILADPRRHLSIDRFSESQVRTYIGRRSLFLQDEEIKLLHEKSEGIPLYLHYICTKLEEAKGNEYESVIRSFPVLFDSKINTYHEQLFADLRTDTVANWVLGLLAIRKEYTSVQVAKAILDGAGLSFDILQIGHVLDRYKHLLKQKDGANFTIFHNSFREFIIGKTTHIRSALQETLIRYYEQHPWEADAYRNYFLHLMSLERYDTITTTVNDEWIKESWKRYKPTAEINENINLAWQACVLKGSVSEFVRIAFLKNQLHQADNNLTGNFTDANYFLDGELYRESFRAVWDGEFSLVENEDFFNDYAIRYYYETGNQIPFSIATQFFSTFRAKAARVDEADLSQHRHDFGTYLRAFSLYTTADELLIEIRSLDGQLTGEDLHALAPFLVKNKQLGQLVSLCEAASEGHFKQYLLSWLLLGLYKAGNADAESYLAAFDISQLTEEQQIVFFEHLVDIQQSHTLFSTYTFPKTQPFLDEEVIDDSGDYQLKLAFRDLLPFLKILFYFSPEKYDAYRVRISALSQYPAGLYFGIASCAKLWADTKRGDNVAERIAQLRQILDDLTIPAHVAQMIESGHGTRAFIKYRLPHIFSQVFRCIVNSCKVVEIKQLVRYWITKHESGGYPDHKCDLAFAQSIISLPELKEEVYTLIKHAEEIARGEQETGVLVNSLSSIGSLYGKARRMDDYNRIYNELLSIACGVSYRKDYQFANIFTPLEKTHAHNSDVTLQRLADNYYLLHKVKDAGNVRMFHICMAELIGFAMERYPQLGFQLLVHEDAHLGRDEAMEIVLKDLIKNNPIENLPYLWLAVITVGKWDNLDSTHDDDDHINNLYKLFFERMVDYTDEKFIESCYQHIWQQFSVERGKPQKIKVINDILQQRSPAPKFLINVPLVQERNVQVTTSPKQAKEKSLAFRQNIDKIALDLLKKMDPDQLKGYLDKNIEALRHNRIKLICRNCWKDLMAFFAPWLANLSPQQKSKINSHFVQIRRKAITVIYDLINAKNVDGRSYTAAVSKSIHELDDEFKGYGLLPESGTGDQFAEINRKVFARTDFSMNVKQVAVTEAQFLELIDAAVVTAYKDWITLAEKYFDKPTLVQVYLHLSKRIFAYRHPQSIVYLDKAFTLAYPLGFQRDEWENELIEWAYTCAPQKANYYLLYSFYIWYIDREYEIPYKIQKKILPWIDKFQEPDFYETYYQANYAFNLKLGEGLQEPVVNSGIILKHVEHTAFPEVILHYLADLCDYPVVKIRLLALDALLRFYKVNTPAFKNFITNDLKNRSANQQEHFITLLHAVALTGGELATLVNRLGWTLQTGYFNIQQGFADLVQCLVENGQAVDPAIINAAKGIHKKPFFPVQALVIPVHPGRDFAFARYQNNLLEDLTESEESETRFDDELHTVLVNEKWNKQTAWREEAAVHRHYNSAASFERLEINGPLFAKLQEMINRQFYKHIRTGCYENSDIIKLKYSFRLYDPGSIATKPFTMPHYIQWKGSAVTEEQFIAFSDMDEVIDNFIKRDVSRITIFESGQCRISEYPAHFSQYFTASLFLAERCASIPKLTELLKSRYPYYHIRNFYQSEMQSYFSEIDPTKKMHGMILPLLAISDNLFRNRDDSSIAIVLPHLYASIGYTVENTEWQGPFKDNTRGYEPLSKGSTLTVDTAALKNYAAECNTGIYLCLDLRRTTEKYKSESDMDWEERIIVRELSL